MNTFNFSEKSVSAINFNIEIEKVTKNLKLKEGKLRRLKRQAGYQKKHRLKTKTAIKKLSQTRYIFTRFLITDFS